MFCFPPYLLCLVCCQDSAVRSLRSTVNALKCSTCIQCRGLHGGPETRGPGTRPGTRTGSGLYFKWSAGSGSGPNLLLRVPGLFNIPESIGEHRTREWSVSVSMRVFCNLQFVKLGWEKCEREIRWKKKTLVTLSRQKQSARGVNVVLQADGDHGFLHEWCGKKAWNKTEETHLLLNTNAVKCNELLILCVFC